jgi:biopolymer transport protein ExbB/TolQ
MLPLAIILLGLCLLASAVVLARAGRDIAATLARPRDRAAVERVLERHAPEMRRQVLAEARAFVADREASVRALQAENAKLRSAVDELQAAEKQRAQRKLRRVS